MVRFHLLCDYNYQSIYSGRTLFPATGFLFLAWESFAILTGKLSSEMRIVFEDVKYIRACNVPIDGAIELVIAIQTASQKFEVNNFL